ncbi:MAG: peptidoglycan binding domain-containing protein, partial [Candidatus Gracilibacteria bacterium]
MEKIKDQSANKSLSAKFIDIAFLITFIAITVLIFTVLIKIFVYSRFIIGTEIGGIDVSRKSISATTSLLENSIAEYSKIPLTIKLDGTTKEIALKDLGVTFLTDNTVQKAKKINETHADILKYIISSKEKFETPFIISIDQEVLVDKLNKEFSLSTLKAVNAWYQFDKQGKLQVTESKDGLVLDKEALIKSLNNALGKIDGHTITISLIPSKPTLTKEELELQKPGIIEALKHKITLSHPEYRNRWTLSLVDHLEWVKFSKKQKMIFEPTKKAFVISKFPKMEVP